jgi:hypothetical protein
MLGSNALDSDRQAMEADRRATLQRLDDVLFVLEEAMAGGHTLVNDKIAEHVTSTVRNIHVGMPLVDALEFTLALQEPYLIHREQSRDRYKHAGQNRRRVRNDLSQVIGGSSHPVVLGPPYGSTTMRVEARER